MEVYGAGRAGGGPEAARPERVDGAEEPRRMAPQPGAGARDPPEDAGPPGGRTAGSGPARGTAAPAAAEPAVAGVPSAGAASPAAHPASGNGGHRVHAAQGQSTLQFPNKEQLGEPANKEPGRAGGGAGSDAAAVAGAARPAEPARGAAATDPSAGAASEARPAEPAGQAAGADPPAAVAASAESAAPTVVPGGAPPAPAGGAAEAEGAAGGAPPEARRSAAAAPSAAPTAASTVPWSNPAPAACSPTRALEDNALPTDLRRSPGSRGGVAVRAGGPPARERPARPAVSSPRDAPGSSGGDRVRDRDRPAPPGRKRPEDAQPGEALGRRCGGSPEAPAGLGGPTTRGRWTAPPAVPPSARGIRCRTPGETRRRNVQRGSAQTHVATAHCRMCPTQRVVGPWPFGHRKGSTPSGHTSWRSRMPVPRACEADSCDADPCEADPCNASSGGADPGDASAPAAGARAGASSPAGEPTGAGSRAEASAAVAEPRDAPALGALGARASETVRPGGDRERPRPGGLSGRGTFRREVPPSPRWSSCRRVVARRADSPWSAVRACQPALGPSRRSCTASCQGVHGCPAWSNGKTGDTSSKC